MQKKLFHFQTKNYRFFLSEEGDMEKDTKKRRCVGGIDEGAVKVQRVWK